ncbi:FG-GAP repeat domain-containing protein [Rhodoferax lacus]|nr:VCBS repeat-containing protein [Rhodoferax lacus]
MPALLMLVLSNQLQAQSISGSPMGTPGDFSVSSSGAAVYSIPIQIPPGVSSMEPKLSLFYNSQGGNGMLGLGWGLSGLSAITRCGRTMAQDGSRGGVNFNTDDRFCLDGQRLMLVSGTYGAAGSEYRTEINSFSMVVANQSGVGGPISFTVKTKSGLTIEYGNTTDSRIEAVKGAGSAATWAIGSVRTWVRNKVTDLSGNYMTVFYEKDTVNGSYYPVRIDYTGNAGSSPMLLPSASVQFVLDASRNDVNAVYQGGAFFKPTKRIANIRTYLGTLLVKDYRIAYGPEVNAIDRSKIASITECDGSSNCLPSTTLTWAQGGANNFADVARLVLPYSIDGVYIRPNIVTDVNGNGPPGTALTSQYGTLQGWSNNNVFPRVLADVNGDGLPDIVGFGPGGVSVSLNTLNTGEGKYATPAVALANQFSAPAWTDNLTHPRFLSDVNGDGLPEIVGFGPAGVFVSINTGNGTFATPKPWLASQFSPSQGWANNDAYPRMLVDMDGDGRPDVVGFANDGMYVATNNGNGFNPPVQRIGGEFGLKQGWAGQTQTPRYVMDINGDGLPDIVGFSESGVVVGINTGTGFLAPGVVAATPKYGCPNGGYLGQEETGGMLCYSGTKGNSKYWAPIVDYSCSSGMTSGSNCILASAATYGGTNWAMGQFGTRQGWANNSETPRQLDDVNGDGLPDIVGFGPGGVVVSLNTGAGFASPTAWLLSQLVIPPINQRSEK